MADDVPVSREDGPATRGTAQGTEFLANVTTADDQDQARDLLYR